MKQTGTGVTLILLLGTHGPLQRGRSPCSCMTVFHLGSKCDRTTVATAAPQARTATTTTTMSLPHSHHTPPSHSHIPLHHRHHHHHHCYTEPMPPPNLSSCRQHRLAPPHTQLLLPQPLSPLKCTTGSPGCCLHPPFLARQGRRGSTREFPATGASTCTRSWPPATGARRRGLMPPCPPQAGRPSYPPGTAP